MQIRFTAGIIVPEYVWQRKDENKISRKMEYREEYATMKTWK